MPVPTGSTDETTTTPATEAVASTKPFRIWIIVLVCFIGFMALCTYLRYAYVSDKQAGKKNEPAQNNGPVYPIRGSFVITQNGWSQPIALESDQTIAVFLNEDDTWLDTRLNNTREFRQAPRRSADWRPNNLGNDEISILEYRVTPGTKISTATMRYVITRKS